MADLSQMQTFIEVARSGSFSAAARALSVPRSTVSARVRALEERLNVRLLHRTTRIVALTDEGRRYRERCEELLDRLLETEAELSRPADISGTVRMTVPIDMPMPRLAQVLASFAESHPAIRVEVGVTDQVVDLVANNVDLALRGGAPGTDGLVARRLGEGRLALFASPAYIGSKPAPKNLAALSDHPVLDPTAQGTRWLTAKFRAGQIETRNFALAKALAVACQGIALLPESICREEVQSGQLVQLAFDDPLPSLPLYIVMPTRQHVSARVRALVDFLNAPGKHSLVG